jgi:hypothetical protein
MESFATSFLYGLHVEDNNVSSGNMTGNEDFSILVEGEESPAHIFWLWSKIILFCLSSFFGVVFL